MKGRSVPLVVWPRGSSVGVSRVISPSSGGVKPQRLPASPAEQPLPPGADSGVILLGRIAAGSGFSPSCPGPEQDALSPAGGVQPGRHRVGSAPRGEAEPGCPTSLDFHASLMSCLERGRGAAPAARLGVFGAGKALGRLQPRGRGHRWALQCPVCGALGASVGPGDAPRPVDMAVCRWVRAGLVGSGSHPWEPAGTREGRWGETGGSALARGEAARAATCMTPPKAAAGMSPSLVGQSRQDGTGQL